MAAVSARSGTALTIRQHYLDVLHHALTFIFQYVAMQDVLIDVALVTGGHLAPIVLRHQQRVLSGADQIIVLRIDVIRLGPKGRIGYADDLEGVHVDVKRMASDLGI